MCLQVGIPSIRGIIHWKPEYREVTLRRELDSERCVSNDDLCRQVLTQIIRGKHWGARGGAVLCTASVNQLIPLCFSSSPRDETGPLKETCSRYLCLTAARSEESTGKPREICGTSSTHTHTNQMT